jgi:hypothetical protein
MYTIGPERLDFLDGAVEEVFDDETVASKEARGWGTNNSDFEAYCVDLALPNHPEGLQGIVERHVGRHEHNVGLDLAGGSDGVALQDLLNDGILGTAILTNYYDLRTDSAKQEQRLHHVAGDLAERDTWEEILVHQRHYAPDGLALIMHRPVGGLQNFAPDIYREAAHLLLDIARPGGVVLYQVPTSLTRRGREHYLELVRPSMRARDDIEEPIPSFVHGENKKPVLDSVIIVKKS